MTTFIKDIAHICSGKAIPSEEIINHWQDDYYPCYGGNGIRGFVKDYLYDGFYPIIGRVGALCGNVHITNGRFFPTEHALVVILKSDDNPYYIEQLLKHLNLRQYAKGVAQPVLSASTVSNIKIDLPPLAEQERIVAELDLLTEIIDKQKAQLKELDTLAQSIFYDMFGDPVENEKGWNVESLGDFCSDVSYGTSLPSSPNGRYVYLRMNNITYSGEIDLSDIKYIDLDQTDFDKYSVHEGDILFNRTNSADLVGKTTWFHGLEPMVIAGYIIRVRLKKGLIPSFVSSFMNTKEMKAVLKMMGKGAVNQSNINSKELRNIQIIIPPLSLQQSFADKINVIEQQKAAITQSIAETQKLFDYTMDTYFG